MSDSAARRTLPVRPSKEHLRKQAKRLARERGLRLAMAQRLLSAEYGATSWIDLMQRVDATTDRPPAARSALARSAEAGDLAGVRTLLAQGHAPDGVETDEASPLWLACAGDAPPDVRLPIADALLAAGADARRGVAASTPLHVAAARGPLRLVEHLIAHGGIEWQLDSRGWSALDAARHGSTADRDEIVTLLDRPVITDSQFRAAVTAIQTGDAVDLARLLDATPGLLRGRIVEPDCYHQAARSQYFLDPKLFWFIANNPRFVRNVPDNIVEIAKLMLARGVEAADLQYALELVMTSASAREHGQQIPLMTLLLEAGAKPSERSLAMTLAHGELEAVRSLLAAGAPMTAPIAAALGRIDELQALLANASSDEIQMVLAQAVINGQMEAARVALDVGADPNRFMPVHAHSTPLHQAALIEDVALIDLLVARGARPDIRDTMWNGTPLDWAIHGGKAVSRARLAES